ncbi:MAG: hypothetical protein SWC96_12255 [Thermodesulfobacteriota bacterium]|nr:hypothetical protein [Thermodesulfobacteriota bacterium]
MAHPKPMAVTKKTACPGANDANGANEKLERLAALLASLSEDRFTGYIKINYSQGSVGRVEKFEEILKK